MEANGYKTVEKAIEVKAGEMCDFVEMLNDPNYRIPKLVVGEFNKWAFNLKTADLGNGKYRLECDITRDVENAAICFTKGGIVVKDIKLGNLKKGKFSQEVDLSNVRKKGLFWEINQIKPLD
jgi:hypothetical protein